jgi:HK97 family phage portal protein
LACKGRRVGILSSIFQPDKRSLSDAAMIRILRGGGSVTPETGMQIASVLSCVRVLSESVAMLPLELRAREGRGTRRATESPLYTLLHDLPNPEMTSIEMRMALQGHLASWGNAYAQMVPSRGGQWIELWPLLPSRMEVLRSPADDLIYVYTQSDGTKITYLAREIMHIRGLSYDGLTGYSPIGQARRTLEAKARMDEYQAAFWANGASAGTVLKHPGKLSDKAFERLMQSWEARHQGAANANRMAILEEGLSVESMGIPQTDAQFLETQKYNRTEIAGLFRVPSHMINDLDRATFSNIEQMSLEFVIYTLLPWLVAWEQAIARDLLTPAERGRYYAKHKIQALLRGDNASRSDFYTSALQWGWMSINDVRELEDLNPVANGDTYFVPLNMIPIDQAIKGVPAATPAQVNAIRAYLEAEHTDGCTCGACRDGGSVSRETRQDDDEAEKLRSSRVEMARAMAPVFEDIATRVTKREARDVGRLVEKHLRKRADADFLDAVREFYADFNGVIEDAFRAALLAYARQAMLAAGAELGKKSLGLTDSLRQFVAEYLANLGNGWASSSRTQIEIVTQEAIDAGSDPADAVGARLTRWEETKPAKVADRQSFEALNALVVASYGAYKITRIRWAARGDSCPFCRQMNGRVAGIEEYFVGDGTSLDGGDAGPMQIKRNVRHGPLHGGCDCVVVADR